MEPLSTVALYFCFKKRNNFSVIDPACSDDQDGLGRSALTYAVHYQQMSALHCLLENEANPNVTAHGKSQTT